MYDDTSDRSHEGEPQWPIRNLDAHAFATSLEIVSDDERLAARPLGFLVGHADGDRADVVEVERGRIGERGLALAVIHEPSCSRCGVRPGLARKIGGVQVAVETTVAGEDATP